MNCPNCGSEINGTEKFCGVCGAPVSVEQPVNYDIPNQQSQSFQPNQTPQINQMPQANQTAQTSYTAHTSNGAGIASLVLGIVGLLLCWLYGIGAILGIVGLIMAANSKKNVGSNGLATAGLVLGIIAVVFGGIFLACTICVCASGAALTNPAYYYY